MPIEVDPVCGRNVDASKAGVEADFRTYQGRTYYFCSMECKQAFDRDPQGYVGVIGVGTGDESQREPAEWHGV